MRRYITYLIAFCLVVSGITGCIRIGATQPNSAPVKTLSASSPIEPAPSPSPIPTLLPSVTQTSSPVVTPEPTPPELDPMRQKALDYFMKVALEAEYHNTAESKGVVKRWEQPICIEIIGKATTKDRTCIDQFLKVLGNIEGLPPITLVEKDGNNKLCFVTLEELPEVCPGYVEGNWAYTSMNWTDYKIDNVISGIAYDKTNQKQRNHLIIERMADSLGLLNDTDQYPDSIFYDKWTETQKLSDMDILLIRMLYSPAVKAGMGANEAKRNLARWLAAQENTDPIK